MPGKLINVLLVEDSATVRAYLRDLVAGQPDMLVVGEAFDGLDGVQKTKRLRPDVVVMDIHMPRLDGVEAIRKIMAEQPTSIVIFCARSDAAGVSRSFEGLKAGALALVEKPNVVSGREQCQTGQELVQRLRVLSGIRPVRRRAPRSAGGATPAPAARRLGGSETPRVTPGTLADAPPARRPTRVDLLAIGASTGGPAALAAVLKGLDRQRVPPIVIAQHIMAGFTAGMADWLGTEVGMPVRVAAPGQLPLRGVAYLAPDDRSLTLDSSGRLRCPNKPTDGIRPSVDLLFESAADALGPRAVGVLLTGMGDDGAAGMATLRRRGAWTIAQSAEGCVVFGMPKAAIERGAACQVAQLDQIGAELTALIP